MLLLKGSKGVLEKLAHFLSNVANTWEVANQEQRNKLARSIFEEMHIESNRIVLIRPKPELEPFFELKQKCHARDIAGDPRGIRTPDLHRDRVAC